MWNVALPAAQLIPFTAYLNFCDYLAKQLYMWWNLGHSVNSAWIKLFFSLHRLSLVFEHGSAFIWYMQITQWSCLFFFFWHHIIYLSFYDILITSSDHTKVVPVLFLTNSFYNQNIIISLGSRIFVNLNGKKKDE